MAILIDRHTDKHIFCLFTVTDVSEEKCDFSFITISANFPLLKITRSLNDVKALRRVSSREYFDPREGQLVRISIVRTGKQDSWCLATQSVLD